jgi:hypothetical protein
MLSSPNTCPAINSLAADAARWITQTNNIHWGEWLCPANHQAHVNVFYFFWFPKFLYNLSVRESVRTVAKRWGRGAQAQMT